MLVRIVLPHGSANSPVISPVIDAMPARTIRRWEPGDAELPRVEELLSYVELSDEDADVLYEQESNEAYAGPEGGDKLGGCASMDSKRRISRVQDMQESDEANLSNRFSGQSPLYVGRQRMRAHHSMRRAQGCRQFRLGMLLGKVAQLTG